MFMFSILLWVVYLYILYTIGFLKFSDLIRLSRPVWEFPYRPLGRYVLCFAKCVCFCEFYSSLGQTPVCSIECSIVK